LVASPYIDLKVGGIDGWDENTLYLIVRNCPALVMEKSAKRVDKT